jgi:glycosyltransferase involved in cell wall biosynthesis
MQVFKKRVVGLLDQPGVTVHGRIGHEELAELMKTSNIWAYPTEFTEISCITAMKMQAAGAVPVCTTVAALDETVQYGHKFDVPDMWTNKEAQDKFINALADVVSNGYEKRDEMREWAIKHYGWDTVASEWLNEFSS